ncbi:cell division protein FtsL [Dokdonella sp. MW10]|uniref:cell division protein FtsL n=1 Tax=Dokdonella sp. MW10 TaxID=2992926 RepID=UPI003F7D69E7
MSVVRVVSMLVLMLAVIGSAIAVVYTRHDSRRMFVELNRLTDERDNLNFEFGRLQLEQATAAENNRIEQVARGRLGMVSPSAAEMIVKRH